MTEQSITPSREDSAQPEALVVEILLPAKWTVQQYEMYIAARGSYIASKDGILPESIAKAYGTLALIDAGFIHVNGLDALKQAILDDKKKIDASADMAAVGYLSAVGAKIEASVNSPLQGWVVK